MWGNGTTGERFTDGKIYVTVGTGSWVLCRAMNPAYKQTMGGVSVLVNADLHFKIPRSSIRKSRLFHTLFTAM